MRRSKLNESNGRCALFFFFFIIVYLLLVENMHQSAVHSTLYIAKNSIVSRENSIQYVCLFTSISLVTRSARLAFARGLQLMQLMAH